MAQRVTPCMFENFGLEPGILKRTLENRLEKMVPALFAGGPIGEVSGRWKDPLPIPLFAGV
jgi:hypothetical protein